MKRSYEFRQIQELEKNGNEKKVQKNKSVDIAIVGSPEQSPEENQKEYGEYIANIIANQIMEAQEQGKKIVFDMATGGTPKPAYEALKRLKAEGKVDFSNVIIIGHEEAWGTYKKGSKSDFDHYREKVAKKFFGDSGVRKIEEPNDISGEEINGNYFPMHLTEDSKESAKKYSEILEKLQTRDDVVTLGLYGVGIDGHIGEIQIQDMGHEATKERQTAYSDDIEHYSVEEGAHKWIDDGGKFRDEDNIFWERKNAKKSHEQQVGKGLRDIWEGYTGIQSAIGLGWKEMLKNETMILAFNNETKALGFELALEGSFDGEIADNKGEKVMDIEYNKGEGEKIFDDLVAYARTLEEEGIMKTGTVDEILEAQKEKKEKEEPESALRSHDFFKAIYSAFDDKKFNSDDVHYQDMWKFSNRYLGKRSPVGRMVGLRKILGRKTIMVAVPEVVQGTKYEALSKHHN